MMFDIDLHPILGTDAVSGDVIVAGHSAPSLQYEYNNDHKNLLWYLWVHQKPIAYKHRKVLIFANPNILLSLLALHH
jgi:hypothetical protein